MLIEPQKNCAAKDLKREVNTYITNFYTLYSNKHLGSERKLSEQKKWAKKLSSECGLSSTFIEQALEELSESCYGDSLTAKNIIEELTSSCHMNQDELHKFISEVSKNCPIDAKKLQKEVAKAEGNKAAAIQAINRSSLKTQLS